MENEPKIPTVEGVAMKLWKQHKESVDEQDRLLNEYDVILSACDTDAARISAFRQFDAEMTAAAKKSNALFQQWQEIMVEIQKL